MTLHGVVWEEPVPRHDPRLAEGPRGALPRKELLVDRVVRRRNREVEVDQALVFSARGMRRFMLTFDLCAEVTDAQFQAVVAASRDRFRDLDPYPEAHLHVYGRRDEGGQDTRILVASIAAWPLADPSPTGGINVR
jgi:hypothetical protein